MSDDVDVPRDHFERCFRAYSRSILAYALRRTPAASDAADVVAETFVVVWRRIDELPAEPETLLWLYGVARRVVANTNRGHRRRRKLAERLRREVAAEAAASDSWRDPDLVRSVASAMGVLRETEREVLLLTVAEGLTPAQIARSLDLRPETVRTHLHRARLRLRTALVDDGWDELKRDGPGGHETSRRARDGSRDLGAGS